MPFAGGPLAYGRRAVDPSLGFVMGWSMFLECQFATIATALATGRLHRLPGQPRKTRARPSPCGRPWRTVAVFFLLHAWGVKEQSRAMVVMTYGAILGLVIFWVAAATALLVGPRLARPRAARGRRAGRRCWTPCPTPCGGWSSSRRWPWPPRRPTSRTAPSRAAWSGRSLTLIVLVVLTWLFACGAVDSQRPGRRSPCGRHRGRHHLSAGRGDADACPPGSPPVRLRLRRHRPVRHDRQLPRHGLRHQPAGVRPGPGRLPAGVPRARSTASGGRRCSPCWRAA